MEVVGFFLKCSRQNGGRSYVVDVAPAAFAAHAVVVAERRYTD